MDKNNPIVNRLSNLVEQLSQRTNAMFQDSDMVFHVYRANIIYGQLLNKSPGKDQLMIQIPGPFSGVDFEDAVIAARTCLDTDRYKELYPDSKIIGLVYEGFMDNMFPAPTPAPEGVKIASPTTTGCANPGCRHCK